VKTTLVLGLVAAAVAVTGGLLDQRWLLAPGVIGLLAVLLVLPWLRPPDASPRGAREDRR
jgi:hypothetical protein